MAVSWNLKRALKDGMNLSPSRNGINKLLPSKQHSSSWSILSERETVINARLLSATAEKKISTWFSNQRVLLKSHKATESSFIFSFTFRLSFHRLWHRLLRSLLLYFKSLLPLELKTVLSFLWIHFYIRSFFSSACHKHNCQLPLIIHDETPTHEKRFQLIFLTSRKLPATELIEMQ